MQWNRGAENLKRFSGSRTEWKQWDRFSFEPVPVTIAITENTNTYGLGEG